MNLKPLMLWCSAGALLLGSVGAHAGVMVGNFSGVVLAHEDIDFWDDSIDVWNGDINGQGFTGKVWWSTGLPPNGFGSAGRGLYAAETNRWVGLEFTIDGKTFAVSKNDYPAMEQSYDDVGESVYILNPDETAADEYLYVADDSYHQSRNGDYMRKSSSIGLVDLKVGLKGVGLEQVFSYVAPTESYSYAYLWLDGRIDGKFIDAMAYMQINEFHLSPMTSSVPEPSPLVLTSIALLGIGWRYRRQRQCS